MFLYLLVSKTISVLVPYCCPKNFFLLKIFMGFWGSNMLKNSCSKTNFAHVLESLAIRAVQMLVHGHGGGTYSVPLNKVKRLGPCMLARL